MHFVVQAEVDDGLLQLHNMTKERVLLSKEEQRVFEQCPTDLPKLIDRWFLVPMNDKKEITDDKEFPYPKVRCHRPHGNDGTHICLLLVREEQSVGTKGIGGRQPD